MATIVHNVPLVAQNTQFECWIACYRMVEAWYKNLGLQRPKVSRAAMIRFAGGEVPLKEERIQDFARLVGLTIIHSPATLEDVTRLVRTYGPLWYPGLVHDHKAPTSGHVVVITGIENDLVCLNDPYPVGTGSKGDLFDPADFFGGYLRPVSDPAPFLVMLKGSRPRG